MTEEDRRYFAALLKRGPSPIGRFWMVEIDGWRPVADSCHRNAVELAERLPRYRAVRGWLFDYGQRAMCHSLVWDSDFGELVEITPPDTAEAPKAERWYDYTFLTHEGSDDLFFDLSRRVGPGWILLSQIPEVDLLEHRNGRG